MAALTGTAGPAEAQSPEDVLSHFRCYGTEGNVPPQQDVGLTDQFGSATATIGAPLFGRPNEFCTPADKTVGGVLTARRNPQAHLMCFSIAQTASPTPTVEVTNQFGTDTLQVLDRQRLCVPSVKIEAAETPPTVAEIEAQLDHFECYRVVGGTVTGGPATVADQFGDSDTEVGGPDELCNPVTKEHLGTTPVNRPSAHLVCYGTFSSAAANKFIQIQNQFFPAGGSEFVGHEQRLCVPSLKNDVGPPPPPVPLTKQCAHAQAKAEEKCDHKGATSKQCAKALATEEQRCA